MLGQEERDELEAKALCYYCVGEAYLRAEIQRKGQSGRCSYCHRLAEGYFISELAERIEKVFEEHYVRTSDQPNSWQLALLSDRESEYDWERAGYPVIQVIANAAEIPEVVAEDIQRILNDKHHDYDSAAMGEETEFCSDSCYEEKQTSDHLASVFSGIDAMSTAEGRRMVMDAGPGTRLSAIYRARVFQSDDRLTAALCRPDRQLGSPPANLASAGRMNARGISVFYGANEPRGAIAEVRPPVGSQVAVARFEIIRALRLLDLTALSVASEYGSVFDPELAGRLERAMFLRSLSQRITRPVMPDDEAFDYLPTQAIADFLATEREPPIDGIVFPSVQAAGGALNVVLFQKVAQVEALEIPKGTTIKARTGQMYEEGWETEYVVIEEVPPMPAETAADSGRWPHLTTPADAPWRPRDPNYREPTLRLDMESIKVNIVQRVVFETIEHDVLRHRFEKRKCDF